MCHPFGCASDISVGNSAFVHLSQCLWNLKTIILCSVLNHSYFLRADGSSPTPLVPKLNRLDLKQSSAYWNWGKQEFQEITRPSSQFFFLNMWLSRSLQEQIISLCVILSSIKKALCFWVLYDSNISIWEAAVHDSGSLSIYYWHESEFWDSCAAGVLIRAGFKR